MRTPWIWSVSLGRWWGVHLRLHLFFFLFATFTVYITSHALPEPNWLGFVCPLALLLSVLLHEVGHVVVARKLGGVADEIVLSPLGGLSAVRVPYEPHSELVAIMAGTLVNATVCLICAIALVVIDAEQANLTQLLAIAVSYFDQPQPLNAVSVLKLVFWLNWSLILVNLIPAFPFDGGRSLHAVLSFLWPELEPKQSLVTICRLGKVISVLLLLCAWNEFPSRDLPQPSAQPPAWLALALLSIYVFFCSRREELQQAEAEHDDDTVFGYDFSQGYTSLERSLTDEEEPDSKTTTSPFRFVQAWIDKRKAEQHKRALEQEREDEKRVDEILGRLHDGGGLHSLSAEDRALLERVSKRYRSRPT